MPLAAPVELQVLSGHDEQAAAEPLPAGVITIYPSSHARKIICEPSVDTFS